MARRQQSDKRGLRIRFGEYRMRRNSVRGTQRDRIQNSASDRNEVRSEDEPIEGCALKLSNHLRSVTMLEYAVRAEVLIDFTEMRFRFGRAAGPRYAGFSVDDNRARGVDGIPRVQRNQRQHRSRCIASRVCNELWAATLLLLEFRQAVDGLF